MCEYSFAPNRRLGTRPRNSNARTHASKDACSPARADTDTHARVHRHAHAHVHTLTDARRHAHTLRRTSAPPPETGRGTASLPRGEARHSHTVGRAARTGMPPAKLSAFGACRPQHADRAEMRFARNQQCHSRCQPGRCRRRPLEFAKQISMTVPLPCSGWNTRSPSSHAAPTRPSEPHPLTAYRPSACGTHRLDS